MFFVELENLRDLLLYLLSRKKLWVLQPSQLHQVVQGARISLQVINITRDNVHAKQIVRTLSRSYILPYIFDISL